VVVYEIVVRSLCAVRRTLKKRGL